MNLTDFQQQLQTHLYLRFDYRVLHWTPVAGSTINDCYQLSLQDGQTLFLKYRDNPATGFYEAEKQNLYALQASECLKVPKVIDQTEDALILRWIPHGPPSDSAQFKLGQQLAQLHSQPAPCFGFEQDNFCGLSPQHNPKMDNGIEFFAQHRLLSQGQQARDAGYLTFHEFKQLEQISQRLAQWLPEQTPALLHGDLWAGNFMVDDQDTPWLIDPACYWGWPEVDLATSHMFGGFSEAFYRGYSDRRTVEPGFEERIDLYNLYHWLNHLNMFGSQYHSAVSGILRRFTSP